MFRYWIIWFVGSSVDGFVGGSLFDMCCCERRCDCQYERDYLNFESCCWKNL